MNLVNLMFGVCFFLLGAFFDHLINSGFLRKTMDLLHDMMDALDQSQKGWNESNEMLRKIIDGAKIYADKNKEKETV